MGFVTIDEAGRAAGSGDFRRDSLFGVGSAGGDFDGAKAVAFDQL